MLTTETTHIHNCLTAFGPGQPGTRRNTHPLTPILIIGHPLSSSSIYNDEFSSKSTEIFERIMLMHLKHG